MPRMQASASDQQRGMGQGGQPAWKRLGAAARRQKLQTPNKQQQQNWNQKTAGAHQFKQPFRPRPAFSNLQQQARELLQLQQETPSYTTLRIAAAGSTDLLLSFLNCHMLLLVGNSIAAVHTTSTSSSIDTQLTSRQRRALLRQALVCISWHCATHQLLPAEAQRLQRIMLQQLLPALAPHVPRTQPAVLARVVFALGTCAATVWDNDDEDGDADDDAIVNATSGHDDHIAGPSDLQVLPTTVAAPAQNSAQQQWRRQLSAGYLPLDEGKQPRNLERHMVAPDEHQQPQDPNHHQQQRHTQQQQQPQSLGAGAPGCPQQRVQLSSEAWVQLLLRCLPPGQLTAGALLAAWKGCALHEVRPPEDWLLKASTAAYYALQQNKLDFNDVAALLQACAQLEYSPPSWLMHYLVARAQQQLPLFNPADLSGVLSSLQTLSFRPSNTFLRVWCESSSRLLRGMNISQLAAAGEALSWAGHSPAPWWARRFIDASLPLLPIAAPDELLLLLDASLSLRLQPPVHWIHECYCHLRASRQQLTLSQIADAAHVLAHLQPLPDSLVAHHRAWLAVCLGQQQVEDVAALSRSELLYVLYAVGKLQVRRTKPWLTSALQQLHRQLPGARPAEFVATFVVFSYFRRQLQTRELVQLAWLGDVLAAVCDNLKELSYEGLLQLLLACADLDSGQQLQQPEQSTELEVLSSNSAAAGSKSGDIMKQEEGVSVQQHTRECSALEADDQQPTVHKLQHSISILVTAFLKQAIRLDLVQLSRVCKALDSGVSSKKPVWYLQLLQQCKSALANQA